MAKPTFYHLPKEKRKQVLAACKREFEQYAHAEAKVSHIIADLSIARGSFYQYFEDITDAYMTVLQNETVETHALFLRVFKEKNGRLFEALEAYGELIAEELYRPDRYSLYRNRYLHWTPELEAAWQKAQQSDAPSSFATNPMAQEARLPETVQLVKAVVHDLIRRLFTESWSHEEFLKHYRQHMHWLEVGLPDEIFTV